MRGLNTTRPTGNSATATAPVTPADSKFLLILFLPYNKLSIWYVGSRTSEPSKANLCNRRSVVGQSKVVKYLKFGRMLRIRVLPMYSLSLYNCIVILYSASHCRYKYIYLSSCLFFPTVGAEQMQSSDEIK